MHKQLLSLLTAPLALFSQEQESKYPDLNVLPESSIVKKYCDSKENNYYCKKMAIFFYCAQHKYDNGVTESYCNHFDHRIDFLNDPYCNLDYYTKQICAEINAGPKETVAEMILMREELKKASFAGEKIASESSEQESTSEAQE